MKIDAHHHLWSIDRFDYAWMTGAQLSPLQRDFTPMDLLPLLKAHDIDRSVLVQTISSIDETKWFLQLSQEYDFIAGVVGWVDLTNPAVGDMLGALLQQPGRLLGIRHQVHDESDDQWLLRSDVQQGLRALADRSLPYDLLVRPRHLVAAAQVADRLANLPLVVDHIAKPGIAMEEWDSWAGDMYALSRRANVFCKLSGMITEADWQTWRPQNLRRYIDHVLNCFGTKRVMFGSDWPVCLLAGSYERVVEAISTNLDALSASEKKAVFGGNAVGFYGIDVEDKAQENPRHTV